MEFETLRTVADLEKRIEHLPPHFRNFVLDLIANRDDPEARIVAHHMVGAIAGVIDYPDPEALHRAIRLPKASTDSEKPALAQALSELPRETKDSLTNKEKALLALYTLLELSPDRSFTAREINNRAEVLFDERIVHITCAIEPNWILSVEKQMTLSEGGKEEAGFLLKRLGIEK